MNKKRWLIFSGILCFLVLAFLLSWVLTTNQAGAPGDNEAKKTPSTDYSTPTFFLHGYSGTAGSTNQMITASEQSGMAKKVLTATVNKTGEVQLTGFWNRAAVNPMIQVVFKDNTNPDEQVLGKWVASVVNKVNAQFPFKRFNVVAHSMGNTATYNYAVVQQTAGMPHLNKWISIAGPFDGIVGTTTAESVSGPNNKPNIQTDNFKLLYAQRQNFPKQVKILNIYGNLNDGSNSDGRVTTASARSLAYLLKNQVKAYQETEIEGKSAQHSQLHQNLTVDSKIQHFLWEK